MTKQTMRRSNLSNIAVYPTMRLWNVLTTRCNSLKDKPEIIKSFAMFVILLSHGWFHFPQVNVYAVSNIVSGHTAGTVGLFVVWIAADKPSFYWKKLLNHPTSMEDVILCKRTLTKTFSSANEGECTNCKIIC